MTVAGGAAGLAALAAIGIPAGREACSTNIPEIDSTKINSENMETDVLVVGGGIAGLFAAVKAHDAGARVLLVSKGRLGASGQTPFARGIFAYDPQNATLSMDDFVALVSKSAIGTNNKAFTRQLAEQSLARVNELNAWGFFESPLFHDSFSRPIKQRNIRVIERVMLTHLLKEDGRVIGAAGFNLDTATIHFFTAKSVILCTGAGGFKPNGFPICDLTHDGTTMAYRTGAKVTGKEWNDGHPANLEHPAAVYQQWEGVINRNPSVTSISVRHDLGVELNYNIYKHGLELEATGNPPFMNVADEGGPARPDGFDKPGHPPGDKQHPEGPFNGKRKDENGPPGMGGVPSGGASAGMSIHKAEGLVPINLNGESTIPGLYAAGDALGSHMAGGIYTQIGSSLAGSAVQGAVAGETAARAAKNVEPPPFSRDKRQKIESEILAPLRKKRGYSPAWVTQTLQSIMIPNFILYIKKERLMDAALAYVEELRDHHQPMLMAADMHELRLAHETANMILNAEMKLRASLYRKESRCSHYRLDFPDIDTKNWNCWINLYQGEDGLMKLEKQPFESWSVVSKRVLPP